MTDLSLLLDNKPWLVLTGAGISVNSGIPTYRDDKGNWLRSDPITHQQFTQHERQRKRYWLRSAVGWPMVNQAKPNDVHRQLVLLEDKQLISGVITQNVDRLHQAAGQKNVIDLHGRLDQVSCLGCGRIISRQSLQPKLQSLNPFIDELTGQIRPDGDAEVESIWVDQMSLVGCHECGGILKPDVVFFGGTISQSTHQATAEIYQKSAGVLVLGSSLMVFSGFRLCRQAKQDGKPLAIINKGRTRADQLADLKVSSDCGEVLNQWLASI
ncbi:MAG: NAD-dependent protein deacetylase [Kangiellaceae bacterium]|jgi:NAD-dependent SIR2 family protein deacetylase|nr:NAD-dependent protein deacetylase [Kangiellaceae bacterium]